MIEPNIDRLILYGVQYSFVESDRLLFVSEYRCQTKVLITEIAVAETLLVFTHVQKYFVMHQQ